VSHRSQLGGLLHLLLQLLEVLLTLLFSCFFAFLGSVDVYSKFVAQVVRELKLLVGDGLRFGLSLIVLLLLGVVLKVAETEETLAELDVLHQSLSQTVADLLQVEVAQRRGHFLAVQTMPEVPGCVSLLLRNQWVPLLLLCRFAFGVLLYLVFDWLADGEHLVEFRSFGGQRGFFLAQESLHVCGFGLRLLR